jgi:hypothetical protein
VYPRCSVAAVWKDSSVDLLSRLPAGRQRNDFGSRQRQKFFFPSKRSIPILRLIHPHIECLMETLSPRVKRPNREADHSSPSSLEVKKA